LTDDELFNAKGRLIAICTQKFMPPPKFTSKSSGVAHKPAWIAVCTAFEKEFVSITEKSKKLAENHAAAKAIKYYKMTSEEGPSEGGDKAPSATPTVVNERRLVIIDSTTVGKLLFCPALLSTNVDVCVLSLSERVKAPDGLQYRSVQLGSAESQEVFAEVSVDITTQLATSDDIVRVIIASARPELVHLVSVLQRRFFSDKPSSVHRVQMQRQLKAALLDR